MIGLWFCLFFFCVSTPLSVLIGMAVWKNQKAHSKSYFKILVFTTVMNTLGWTNYFLAMQLPLATCGDCLLARFLPLVPWPISSCLAAGICYFNYVQFSSILLLSLNRFSYVFFQLAYETIWKTPLNYALLITALWPIVAVGHDIMTETAFVYFDYADMYRIESVMPNRKFNDTTVYFFAGCGFAILSFLLNVCSMARVVLRFRYYKHISRVEEIRLVVFNHVYFFLASVFIVDSLLVSVPNASFGATYLYSCFFQFACLFPPVILLLCSPTLRTDVRKLLCSNQTGVLNNAFVSEASSSQ